MSSITGHTHPGVRERRREHTRYVVNLCALDLFERHGADGTTVDEIARAAGVSPRTFFRYFDTKEDSVLTTHRIFYAAMVEWMGRIDPHRNVLDQLEAEFARVIDDGLTDPEAVTIALRERRLACRDAGIRAAAHRAGERHRADAGDRIAAAVPGLGRQSAFIALDIAGYGLWGAVDEWTRLREVDPAADLSSVYRSTRSLLRTLVTRG